jgi:F-type H+-transporting ATPase subunit b
MDELIKTFHIDWHLLVAQGVNFLIVLTVLYFFAVKPVMKIMRERTRTIEESIKNAEIIETNLKRSEEERQAEVTKGRREAQEIIVTAEKQAESVHKEKLEKARLETDKNVQSAKVTIAQEREQMIKSVKGELADLVVLVSEKVTAKSINDKLQRKLIDEAIDNVRQEKL